MQKNLLLFVAFILFAGCFNCEAQLKKVAVAVRKKGTLSTSASSGGGACSQCPICIDSINTNNLMMLDPSTAFFCLNDDSMVLKASSDCGGGGTWYYNDLNHPLASFPNGNYDSTIIKKTGIYYFESKWNTTGILITSTIPLDSMPSKTIFCPRGSITLNPLAGSYSNYQWYNNTALLQGENSKSYIASKTGNYYVQTTNSNNGCVLNSETINVTVYTPPSQLNITGDDTLNTTLILDNNESDLNPESVTWYRNGTPIRSFDDYGIVVAGGHGAGNGLNQLNQPDGIFVDSMENIYVADYNNSRIMKWSAGSNTGVQIIGEEFEPTDVLLDSPFLYISHYYAIDEFSPSLGVRDVYAPGNGYANTWGLAVNLNHELYFAGNKEIFQGSDFQFIELPGSVYEGDDLSGINGVAGNNQFGSGLASLNYPNGIYVDSLDNLYVSDNLTDSLNNFYGRIVKWPPGATVANLVAGVGYGNAPNQIGFAAGVTFDKGGNMYVSDAGNNRVQLWRPGADHGITIASGFTPWGIKVDDSDNVYVADQTNNQVLKFPSLLKNSIEADTPGVYTAVVTYPGGCTTTSNDFKVSGALPVNLINFTGQLKNNNAVLTWQTVSEYNSSYFEVQRSLNGLNFITVGKVPASGNSNSLLNYMYDDNNVNTLNTNIIYYRLNEVDIDGKAVQSNIISISLERLGWSFSVSPNPVKSSLRIRMNNLYGHTNISLFDMTGRRIIFQQLNASGNDVVNLNTYNLSAGLYTIKILNNGQSENIKFEKE